MFFFCFFKAIVYFVILYKFSLCFFVHIFIDAAAALEMTGNRFREKRFEKALCCTFSPSDKYPDLVYNNT